MRLSCPHLGTFGVRLSSFAILGVTMKFTFTALEIPDIIEIEHERAGDARGFFSETFRRDVFEKAGLPSFVQENHSRSTQGVLRGLHYQNPPKAQGKLVRCARGAIFDVAVDLRRQSPHFGKWVGRTLSDENRHFLYLPPGFAHGFCVLSDWADVLYLQTEYYSLEHEGGIIWNDRDIGIAWPVQEPVLSPKDAKYPPLKKADLRF